MPLKKNIALTPKDAKVGYIRFVTGDELIWSLLQESVKVEPVDGMTCRVDSFDPKVIGGLILIKHCPYRLNERSILSFGHPILLWSIGCQKFMLNAFLLKIFFNSIILELGAIVTPYLLDLVIKLILALFKNFLSTSCVSLLSCKKNTQEKHE
jgi:hypothetical protein